MTPVEQSLSQSSTVVVFSHGGVEQVQLQPQKEAGFVCRAAVSALKATHSTTLEITELNYHIVQHRHWQARVQLVQHRQSASVCCRVCG